MEHNVDGCVRSGEFIADYFESNTGQTLVSDAVQPNGVDLSIGEIYRLEGESFISNEEYEKAARFKEAPQNGEYYLTPDTGYVVVYDEPVSIPEDHIALVYPRSRLMRCGLQIETAVWDAGYTGVGEGQLVVSQPAHITEDCRVAQMIFIKTEKLNESYSGTHQGERL